MLKGQGVILKRRVPHGNSGMPRVLRIREQAEVGELEQADEVRAPLKARHVGPLPGPRVREREAHKDCQEKNKG
jgi:hypothetical protein